MEKLQTRYLCLTVYPLWSRMLRQVLTTNFLLPHMASYGLKIIIFYLLGDRTENIERKPFSGFEYD